MIGGTIDFLAESEHPNYGITEEIRGLLLEESASEADLLLKPARKAFEIRGVSTADISLAYVHYVREALKAAGATGAISVNADAAKFTPVFDGLDWCLTDVSPVLNRDLYSSYPLDSDTQLMNGIKVSKNSSDNKRLIVYDRALKVSNVVWQDNAAFNTPRSFHGFGLQQGTGTILPVSNWDSVAVLGGDCIEDGPKDNTYYPVVSNFTAYQSAMTEAGLHPSQGVKLDHSRVVVNNPGSNVMANGIYDFVLAYYNPASTGASAADNTGKDKLPAWPSSGLTFDGSRNGGVSSRVIGGITAASADRKAPAAIDGYQKGEPRVDYVGNITVPMANYMVSSLHIDEFKNTNIIGDGSGWYVWNGTTGKNGNNLTLPPIANVGLIGDYSGIDALNANVKGMLDIKGAAPQGIAPSISTIKRIYQLMG
jgi:hypothetical protein